MKELNDLVALVGQGNIKKGAGIGAAVGAALGASEGKALKQGVVGAGLGAALMWALDQYSFDTVEQVSEKTADQPEAPADAK